MLNTPMKTPVASTIRFGQIILTTLLIVIGTLTSHAQLSSVTITEVEKREDCDSAYWRVRFTVDTPNVNGGYIVQKITLSGDIHQCDDTRIGINDIVYWESWPVGANANSSGEEWPAADGSGNTWNDQYLAYARHGTYGEVTWTGQVAFVPSPTPGTNPDTNTPNTWSDTAVSYALGLLATYTEPSYWDSLEASGVLSDHNATLTWRCCNDSADTIYFHDLIGPDTAEVPVDTTETPDDPTDPTDPDGGSGGDGNDPDDTGGSDGTGGEGDGSVPPGSGKLGIGTMVKQASNSPSDQQTGERANAERDFRIYPVPFKDQVTVVLTWEPENKLEVRILNLSGQVVFVEQGRFEQVFELNVVDLPEGMYSLQVEDLNTGETHYHTVVK